jgi:hypothetical protein
MSPQRASEPWRRASDIAFVDDGERITLLRVVALADERPWLLTGSAATLWRLLACPHSAQQIIDLLCSSAAGEQRASIERGVLTLLDSFRARGFASNEPRSGSVDDDRE